MAGLADRFEIEARNRITTSDDAVVGPPGLRHQHVFVARGFRLDDVAGRRRADFLVRREQYGDRQRGGEGGARQLANGFEGEVIAALHVEDTGAKALVALAPPSQLLNRADRVNRVEMACYQDARLAPFWMRKF